MKYFIILFFTIAFSFTNAQDIVLRKKIEIADVSFVYNFFEIDNNYYVACGTDGGTVYLFKYDRNFNNPEKIKQFAKPSGYHISPKNNYFQFYDNKFICFIMLNPSVFSNTNYPNIIELDLFGNEVTNNIYDKDIELQISGSKIFLNSIDENNYYVTYSFIGQNGSSHYFNIYKVNSELVIKNNIEPYTDNKSRRIDNLTDSYYKDSIYYFTGTHFSDKEDSSMVFKMKYNDEGERVFEKYLYYPKSIAMNRIDFFQDKLIMTGRKYNEKNDKEEQLVSYGFTISDTTGKIISRKEYSYGTYNSIPAFNEQKYIPTSDGGFLIGILAGSYYEDNPNRINRSTYDSYVVKTDSLGNYEWHAEIKTEGREENINFMFEDSNGDYIIFNRVIPTTVENLEQGEEYMEMIKIQSPYSSVEENYTSESGISIVPNPAGEYIEIMISSDSKGACPLVSSNEIEIYDVLGNVQINYEFQITNYDIPHKIGISHLPKGVYFVKIGNNVEKFVKI